MDAKQEGTRGSDKESDEGTQTGSSSMGWSEGSHHVGDRPPAVIRLIREQCAV